jgi:hypothetical protein
MRIDEHMQAVKYLAQNAALKAQVRWLRKMLRQAYAHIRTGLDDEDEVAAWLAEYKNEMK